VIVAEKTVVPRGALVTGSVMATKASEVHDPGYLRLTLISIVVNGKTILCGRPAFSPKADRMQVRPQ